MRVIFTQHEGHESISDMQVEISGSREISLGKDGQNELRMGG